MREKFLKEKDSGVDVEFLGNSMGEITGIYFWLRQNKLWCVQGY